MYSVAPTDNLVLEIEDIADRFGLTARDFKKYWHLDLISVGVEIGSNECEGLTRLTCQLGNRVWQAVVGGDKRIVHEEIRFLRGKLSQGWKSSK